MTQLFFQSFCTKNDLKSQPYFFFNLFALKSDPSESSKTKKKKNNRVPKEELKEIIKKKKKQQVCLISKTIEETFSKKKQEKGFGKPFCFGNVCWTDLFVSLYQKQKNNWNKRKKTILCWQEELWKKQNLKCSLFSPCEASSILVKQECFGSFVKITTKKKTFPRILKQTIMSKTQLSKESCNF